MTRTTGCADEPEILTLACQDKLQHMKRLLLASLLLVASAAQAKEVLPWIENDYTRAIARAKSADLPVFVEAWAPW